MPTKRLRGPTRSGVGKLTDTQLDYLINGWHSLDADPAENWEVNGELLPFPSRADMEAAYKKHQAAVEAEVQKQRAWSKELRSWAWWQYVAPEPKRQLSGPKPLRDSYTRRGEPALWENHGDCQKAIFESELEYLTRLNLLQPGDSDEAS